ncbi:MAG: hypothetical protein ABSG53_12220, partial [Thermoguttaceae bacterium]
MNRIRHIIFSFLCCLPLTGCSLYESARQTLWCEPWLFSAKKDDCHTRERCCELANEAWDCQVRQNPRMA